MNKMHNGSVQVPKANAKLKLSNETPTTTATAQTRWLWVACNAWLATHPGESDKRQGLKADRAATKHNRRGFFWIEHDTAI